MYHSPKTASLEESVTGEAERIGATEGGKLDGGVALFLGLTTAGDPGPRSIRLSSVASSRTCGYETPFHIDTHRLWILWGDKIIYFLSYLYTMNIFELVTYSTVFFTYLKKRPCSQIYKVKRNGWDVVYTLFSPVSPTLLCSIYNSAYTRMMKKVKFQTLQEHQL